MLPAKWPQWIIVPIAFLLVAAVTGLGLGLIKVAEAATPGMAVMATPTPPGLAYAGPLSTVCTDCHVDEAKLGESVRDEAELQRLYIDPVDTQVLHGQLGCVTCHEGTPDTDDIDAAHTNLVLDPTVDSVEGCLTCHRDLPNEYPEPNLIAPHDLVVNGSAEDLWCSDCHGSVGHGYDPVTGEVVISMMACLDCHEERQLAVQMEDCEACHTETPAWTPEAECVMCHSLDGYTYEESRENPDLMAYAHAQEGLLCLDCHEQAALEESHVGAVPGGAVEPRMYETGFCTDCHLDNEHTSLEQVAERTAETEVNPHQSHLIGEMSCNTCHKNHQPSQDQCTQCHDPMTEAAGWTAGALTVQELGLQVFEPNMDCTSCKSMTPYVESLENQELSAGVHAAEGLVCIDCHEQDELETTHLEAKPGTRVRALKVSDEFCLGCHVENEHSSYEQVIERTKDFVTEGQNVNPHDPHPEGMSEQYQVYDRQFDCSQCHKMHQQLLPIEGCYTCHHERTVEKCSDCHKQ